MFGQTLADFQMTQAKLADMATAIDAGGAAHLPRRPGRRTCKGERVTREAAMAKMFATEAAQQVIDDAVQMLRRPGREARPPGRAALPRGARAAHLRGRDRGAEADHRQGPAERMSYTAHLDTFARDNLPPRAQWPELRFDLPELQYPARLNCAAELLDKPVTRGHGHRVALRSPDGECTYTQLFTQANRLANVLVREMGLKPGNRVLLRGPNNPMMAACWFAVMKAGGVCVATMPLLRAKELTEIIDKAEVTHALCDKRLDEELKNAQESSCPEGDPILVRRRAGFARRAGAQAAAVVHQRRHRGRRRRADRLHLGHHRQAEGHDALPPRRDRDVRLLPALVPRHAQGRHLLRHAAARLHLRPGRHAVLPDALRRLDACWSRSSRPRRCSRPSSASRRRSASPRRSCTGGWPRIAQQVRSVAR